MPKQGGQGKGKVKKDQKGFGKALMRKQMQGSQVGLLSASLPAWLRRNGCTLTLSPFFWEQNMIRVLMDAAQRRRQI